MNEDDLRARIETYRAIITAGQTAIKSAILINGGGAVAVLAFVPSLLQMNLGLGLFSVTLLCFGFGTLLGAIAAGCTYLAGYHYADALGEADPPNSPAGRSGGRWNKGAMWTVIVSYLLFAVGCVVAFVCFLLWSVPCGGNKP
jgi:hypothetical protein